MITSLQNPRVRSIRALHQRQVRKRTGSFIVDGIRPAIAAMEHDAGVDCIVVAPDLLRSATARSLVARQAANGVTVLEISARVFHSLSSRERPQGLLCVGRQRWVPAAEVPSPRGPGWVALLEPHDPGNLGTILRVCDAVGCDAIFILGAGAADPYDPTALRAAMGSTFAVPLIRAGFEDFVTLTRSLGLPLVGAADDAPQDYRTFQYGSPIALLMGRETMGISAEERLATTDMVRIPMEGSCDSLNLAVATSLILYEAYNQRRFRSDGLLT